MTGLPPPNITWIKNDQPLHQSERIRKLNKNKTIKIKGVRLDDQGNYTCIAENPLGKVNLTLQLNVRHDEILTTTGSPLATKRPTTKHQARGRQSYKIYREAPHHEFVHNGSTFLICRTNPNTLVAIYKFDLKMKKKLDCRNAFRDFSTLCTLGPDHAPSSTHKYLSRHTLFFLRTFFFLQEIEILYHAQIAKKLERSAPAPKLRLVIKKVYPNNNKYRYFSLTTILEIRTRSFETISLFSDLMTNLKTPESSKYLSSCIIILGYSWIMAH